MVIGYHFLLLDGNLMIASMLSLTLSFKSMLNIQRLPKMR